MKHACFVCGTSGRDEPMYTVRGFPIVRCSSCGVGRTRMPDGFKPLDIYDESYFQGGHHDGYADYKGSEATLRQEFESATRQLRSKGARGGRLVEVGCAYGYFLDEAARHFEVCGVEVAQAAATACRARGHDVAAGVLTDSFLAARGPFDAMVMLDVIEHLERPDEVLGLLARHAKPGTHLMLSTGDWSSLAGRALGPRWRLMTPPQHLWFFTPSALTQLLRRVGFEVLEVQYPWKSVPVGLMAWQLGRVIGAQKLLKRLPMPSFGVPINLFDAMRVVARFKG